MHAHNPDDPPTAQQWRQVDSNSAFADLIGPIYMTTDNLPQNETLRLGFRVQSYHLNPRGTCHGGMLAAFADIAVVRGVRAFVPDIISSPTANLTLDFIKPANQGEWIETRLALLNQSGRTIDMSCILLVDQEPIAKANGVLLVRFA